MQKLIKFVLENCDHDFSHDLNSGGCDICFKMISGDEIEFVCIECADYHICRDCYSLERIIHECIPDPDLQDLKRELTQTGYLEDDKCEYSIHRVIVFS